ncbi:hypothetical protein GUJ93_ZPchr0012g21666 [Zizania palustris]|uniref:Uncharacterized protein n=1 Tax=Zizania palustris TaxID=103762 RepID=A0A8J6BQM3_ZIZPA|nr:hypothetical protein GUJ93_ZPchr0004g38783 [Zizania palustris]KAG8092384.1 hypothetical protein GUJ93_ZPchr0012g21666 [Zizania palustris]
MEALESSSSPRWTTNMTEIICTTFCMSHPAMRGPARQSCFLTSVTTKLSYSSSSFVLTISKNKKRIIHAWCHCHAPSFLLPC